MAIFRLSSGIISRGTGGCAVASAAYRHAAAMRSEEDGDSRNYSDKAGELVHSEIALPENAPEWARNRFGAEAFEAAMLEARAAEAGRASGDPSMAEGPAGIGDGSALADGTGRSDGGRTEPDGLGGIPESVGAGGRQELASRHGPASDGGSDAASVWARLSELLWNDVQNSETRLNKFPWKAQLARSLTVSLPAELGHESQIALMRDFVADAFTSRGMVADWVIHDKGDGNPHAHVMLALRTLEADGWGGKARHWNSRALLQEWRESWAAHANTALAREGRAERIDHRSNFDRGIMLQPESHSPYVASHAEAGGNVAREKDRTAEVRERNRQFLIRNPEHVLVVVQSQKAVFTEADVREALLSRLGEALPDAEIDALGDRAMAHPELVELDRATPDGAAQFVTSARAAAEQSLAAAARGLAEQRLEIDASLPGAEALSESLNPGQRAAAEAMLSTQRLTLVQGHAGTGKTFTIAEAARVWQARGYEVIGTAQAGKAVQELGGIRGVKAATIAAWEARWARGDLPPPGRFVVFMDEAGMVGSSQWLRLQDRVEQLGGKLVAVGDPEQLQPVADIAGWQPAARGAGPPVTIDQVVRQERTGDRIASGQLAAGGASVRPAIGHYAKQGSLRLDGQALADPVAALAEEYYLDGGEGDSRIAVGYSNRDVWKLNGRIRGEALRRGVVDASTVRSYGTVDRIDRSGAAPRRVPFRLELGVGDRIMLTRPHRELDLPRSAFGTVTATGKDSIEVAVDGKERTVTIDLAEFRHIDYGYAATVHRAQGLTADRAFVLGHGRMHRHAVYVAMTRHRKSLKVFGRRGHLETVGDLNRLANVPGHLTTGLPDVPDRVWPSSGAPVGEAGAGARLDWMGGDVAGRPSGVLGDTALVGVAERYAGLLSAGWSEGDPVVADDPGGYAREPRKAVDDLLERQSVIRADEVADRLARAVAEPETFLRLFMEAMAHPGLVVLSETGHGGEGRVYTSRDQLRLELDAVDRGVRLALLDGGSGGSGNPPGPAPEERGRLGEAQAAALEHVVSPGRLRLVRGGGGTGKTRVAAAAVEALRREGKRAVGLAPSGAGLDSLRQAGLDDPVSVRSFLNRAEAGHVRLDAGTVIVLDDAGRVGGRQAARLLELVEESGAKLVAMIDGGTQVPLDAGPVFRALEARLGSARMDEAFGRSPERALALADLAGGGAAAEGALAALDAEGAIVAGGTPRKAIEAVADGYMRDGSRDRMALAWSRAEADTLNAGIRKRLDAARADRRNWTAGTDGPFRDLRPGDRIRFVAGTPRQAQDGPVIRAGEAAEFLGRAAGGALLMRVGDGDGAREVEWRPGDTAPEWRWNFAGTVHGELGRRIDSVHLLASAGMNRQLLASAANLHGTGLRVVVPAAESRKLKVLSRIVRRDATARSSLDYGFEPGLAGREALRGRVAERAQPGAGLLASAVERLRAMAGLQADEIPDAAPRGLEGEVLGEVLGAAVLRDGEAPAGADRLGVERYVRSLSDRGDWKRMLERSPKDLTARADALAREAAGTDGSGRPLTTARILARGALVARESGEEGVADLFDAGLAFYGQRAGIARMLGKADGLAAPKTAAGSGRTAAPAPDRRGARRAGGRRRRPMRQGLDIGGVLASVERSDEQVARDALDLFGIGGGRRRRRRVRSCAAERSAAGLWRGRVQALEAVRRASAPAEAPEAAAGGGEGGEGVRTAPAVRDGHLRELALLLACAVTRRVDPESPVHGFGLVDTVHGLLKNAAGSPGGGGQAESGKAARTIARSRAEADLRAAGPEQVRESLMADGTAGSRLKSLLTAPDAGGALPRMREGAASTTDVKAATPTPLERLAGAALAAAGEGPQRQVAEAVAEALGGGSLPMDTAGLRLERNALAAELGAAGGGADPDAGLAERLFAAFTAEEIRAMADGQGRGPDAAGLPDADALAGAVTAVLRAGVAGACRRTGLQRSVAESLGIETAGTDRRSLAAELL